VLPGLRILLTLLLFLPGGTGEFTPPARFREVSEPGLENLFEVDGPLVSGAQPAGDAAFASLARRGVRTVVSVDGVPPDVEGARRHGLRYVHLPIGYDAIAGTNALRLAKAVASLPGPVYIHCHHGRHRGPAAVAVVCRALFGWDAATAHAWLSAAGTDPRYEGLRASATNQGPVSPETLASVTGIFPERAATPPLVDAMVAIDDLFDRLKTARDQGFQASTEGTGGHLATTALKLQELLREASRLGAGVDRTPSFHQDMSAAGGIAESLVQRLETLHTNPDAPSRTAAVKAFQDLSDSCVRCHRRHRDGSLPP
jgi:protein tyrosine phosphatase (PTP) superfamily phosphohydrolase (DUF442 family)